MKRFALAVWVVVGMLVAPGRAAEGGLQNGDKVAICGDSITEQKEYSVYIEDYLLMCQPAKLGRVTQFGWSGETSWDFNGRMNNDAGWLAPTVVTTCYGMNDGGYGALKQDLATRYRNSQKAIVQKFKQMGARLIIVGSPGAVDTKTYNRTPSSSVYNQTLAQFGNIAKEVAQEEEVVFADVHGPMMEAMAKAKAKYGEQYAVAGGDGIHPGRNGQLVMAYAFLKAMGFDGQIGTITVDLGGGKAEASDGHKVLSMNGGAVEIESSRYPFCFYGAPESPGGTRGMLEFIPFNQDLNRFTLVVKNAPAATLRVTWGSASKDFPAADLAKGINLAAEFLDNPFGEAFANVEKAVREQQRFETPMVKVLLHGMPAMRAIVPEEKDAFDRIAQTALSKDKVLWENSAAAVVPVKHTIKIEVAQ